MQFLAPSSYQGSVLQLKKPVYETKHRKPYVSCATGLVYIYLHCGSVYIGQTGRCLNIRLREHASSFCINTVQSTYNDIKKTGKSDRYNRLSLYLDWQKEHMQPPLPELHQGRKAYRHSAKFAQPATPILWSSHQKMGAPLRAVIGAQHLGVLPRSARCGQREMGKRATKSQCVIKKSKFSTISMTKVE